MSWNYILFALVVAGSYHISHGDHMRQAPRYKVNLDISPDARWNDVISHWNVSDVRMKIQKAIDQFIPPSAWPLIGLLADGLDQYLPSPYSQEIPGIAKAYGMEVGQIVALNILYDVTAFCTSIVSQDSNGTIWHARNLDYELGDLLRNISAMIDFQVRGKTLYTTVSYVGHVGAFTGQRPHAYTVTINERNRGDIAENILEALNAIIFKKAAWVSFMLRDALANDATYQDAFNRLVTKQEVAPVYYIIGGVRPGEGAVITRDRVKPVDIWQLDPQNGRWYVLETNYDHWEPPPADDDRRDPGMKSMNALGQKGVNADSLLKVLSIPPVLASSTTYTTVMSAAQPDVFNTHIRNLTP